MIANAHSGRTTNIRVTFDEDLGKFILRGDFRKNVEIIENAWLSDTSTAEEMERLIKQNGYKIRGYGEPTVEKAPETHKRERSESKSADFRFVAEKTRDYLRSASEKSPIYSDILAEMNENTALAETAYAKVFAYCYEEKILPRDVPEDDLNEIISAAVEERANELRGDIPLDTLKDIDKFYVNEENESVTWAYFNPDSSAGGQLVYHTFTYDQIFDAIVQEEPLDYLEQVSKTELVDVTDLSFKKIAAEFLADNESFSTRDGNVGERLSALVEPRYGIFQLKDGENLRDYRFTDTEYMQSHGMYVDRENYNRVYRGRLQPNETLDGIFQKFNINQPEDYHGRSLSVSDVICIKQDGKTTAHFVDSYGFTEIPDFTLSREERKARHTLTDNLTLLAENQIASDEMDTLADKLFRYEQAPKYGGISGYWSIGAGMTADKFEDITTRYHNGEDVRAELAKGMFGKLDHIEFYDHSDGIGEVTISATKDEKSITFRTEGGFEVTHSWETLGNALITAARQEFDRHEELDRQLGAQEETPEITAEPVPDTADFEEIPDEMLRDYPTTPDEPDEPIQMSLFGDFEQDTTEKKIICGVDVEAALKQDLIRHGSGFEDGKFRVEQFYRDNRPDTADFAKFLSKEYGTGGHSGEGKIAWSDHDSKGISLTIKLDNGENTTMNFGWKKVANIISTLIDNQTYITQKDIDSRIKNAQYDVAHNDTDSFEDQSGVKVNFAEAFIATLVSMLAGKQINADEFIKLNSDESYIALAWKYNLALKLKIDPVYIGLEISSVKLDLGADGGVLPSDFDQSIYTTAENLDTLSLNLDLRLNLDIKGQKEEVRLEKYLDLLVKDLGLKLGLTFDKDITYKLGLNLGANLALNDPNSTKIVVEIKNVVEDTNIIAIYVNGQNVYVDLGALGRKAFYLENTNVSELICNEIAKLLGNLNGLVSGTGDAQTAGDAADMSADEKMQVILSIADGKIGVLVMQNVIVGLIAALTSNGSAGDVDIAKVLEAFDLDLSVDVDLQLKPSLSIDVNVDSNLIGLGVSVKAIDLSTGKGSAAYTSVEEKVAREIAKKDYKEITDSSYIGDRYKKEIVDGKVVYVKDDAGTYMPVDHYEALTNAHIVSVDVAMIVDYYGSATYTYIDNERILSSYSPKDRYSKNAHDNRFVQDANGHYVRDGFTFNELIEMLLNMDKLQSILATMLPQIRISTEGGNISFGKIDNAFSVGDLLTRLGLSLVLSDMIDDGFKLDISAKLDLDAIGLSDLSKVDFKNLNLDVKTILKGLEAKIGVDFTYEDGANSKVKINIYLVDGIVYVDLKGLDGPRVQIDLLDLIKKLGVAISADNDAMTAADQSGNGNEGGGSQGGTENKIDFVKILNLVVKNIVLAAKPWEVNPEYNRIDNLGVFVRSNFINDLLSMLFKTKFESANTVVDETQSGIFLRPSSDKFASYGYDEMLTLGLMIALVNKQDPIKDNAGNTKQYTWSLDLGVDAKIDLESVDTYETLLDVDERLEFIALDDYITNILALVNGFYKDSFQKAEEPVDGTVYYTFHEDPAGQYVKKTGMYRLLNEGEKTEGVTLYSRGYATVVAGVGYELVYTQDTAGDFVFDEEKDVFVRKDAYTGASTTYYRREERAIKKVVDGVVTEENEAIANLALYSKFGVPQYQDQNVALSVSGLIYFNSDSAQSANAGGLISNLFVI